MRLRELWVVNEAATPRGSSACSKMDGSMRLAETLEDLFNNADASDYLVPFKDATGASEVAQRQP